MMQHWQRWQRWHDAKVEGLGFPLLVLVLLSFLLSVTPVALSPTSPLLQTALRFPEGGMPPVQDSGRHWHIVRYCFVWTESAVCCMMRQLLLSSCTSPSFLPLKLYFAIFLLSLVSAISAILSSPPLPQFRLELILFYFSFSLMLRSADFVSRLSSPEPGSHLLVCSPAHHFHPCSYYHLNSPISRRMVWRRRSIRLLRCWSV